MQKSELLGVIGVVLMAIPAWDVIEKRGFVVGWGLLFVIAWAVGVGFVVWSAVSNRRSTARSEAAIITLRDDHKVQTDSLQGRIKQLTNESDKIAIAASDLKILKATWGNEHSRTQIEDFLSKKPRNGLAFYVYNDGLHSGLDPAPGVDEKYVEIEYCYPGRASQVVKRFQGEWVFLPEDWKLLDDLKELQANNKILKETFGGCEPIKIRPVLSYRRSQIREGDIQYPHIAWIELVNEGDHNVTIWSPLWERTGPVSCQPPLTCYLHSSKSDIVWNQGADYINLAVNEKLTCCVALLSPSPPDSLDMLLRQRETGTLVFPMKLAGGLAIDRIKV